MIALAYRVLASHAFRRWSVVALTVVLLAAEAAARPGGGHSFSSGSSSSSSSSSSSGSSSYGGSSSSGSSSSGSSGSSGGGVVDSIIGAIIELLIELLLRLIIHLIVTYPQITIPIIVVLALAIYGYRSASKRWSSNNEWASDMEVPNLVPRDPIEPADRWDDDSVALAFLEQPKRGTAVADDARVRLRNSMAVDGGFSVPLFEDFVQGLYCAAHVARGKGTLANLGPYLRLEARASLANLVKNLRDVRGVVVGALSIEEVSVNGDFGRNEARVKIAANYSEERVDGTVESYFAIEEWTLARKSGVRTKPRPTVQTFQCPNCGAALDRAYDGRCEHCKEVVDDGRFDWVVTDITPRQRKREAYLLAGTVEEQGTDKRTLYSERAVSEWKDMLAEDTALTDEAFTARVALIFGELQRAWSDAEWSRARAFVSDSAFESMRYWIDMYEARGLRNVIDAPKLRRIELARVTRDKSLDAVTLRVFASSLDYTVVKGSDEVVAGSNTERRAYTEYWTLVRARGKKGAPLAALQCPNCGAELSVSMAGECTYCHVHVVTGEHDWVLSRIEQDDVYAG